MTRVWVTRAQPGAESTAAAVRALGCEALVAPLIETAAVAFDPPDLAGYAALAFTSAAGVRAFSARTAPTAGVPVWAVGRGTAAAVRAAGWSLAGDADGDGRALAGRLARARPAGIVLAPGAREPAFDLPAALAACGVEARALAVYATAAVAPPPHVVHELHGGRIDAVLLHSPSAARALDAVVGRGPDGVRLLALSRACLPAAPSGWRAEVAAAPRERDLLALLGPLDSRPRAR